jgi:hypothetical protein
MVIITVFQILLMSGNLTEAYKQGIQAYDQCHAPTVRSLWDAFRSELSEFRAEPSQEEAWDVLHSFGRLTWKLTGIPLFWLAKPTVEKHGRRFAESGCIRSSRNCLGIAAKRIQSLLMASNTMILSYIST